MELLVNDLSVHEQFHERETFRTAFVRLMGMRELVRRYGREMHCHTGFLNSNPIPGTTMQEAIARFIRRDERRAAMAWLAKAGPFWDEARRHMGDDWLKYQGEIVTDKAVGEAAFQSLHGVECGVVSLSPSDWEKTPLQVTWCPEETVPGGKSHWDLENFWACQTLEDALMKRDPPIQTWHSLETICRDRFVHLTFTDDCFEPLMGVPFAKCSSEGILRLLKILDTWARNRDDQGKSNEKGRCIQQQHFTGDRASFTDSSATEKRKFCKEMTFDNPDAPGEPLLCSWHGKIAHQALRLHFFWPPKAGKTMYIVYAGPKITKQ